MVGEVPAGRRVGTEVRQFLHRDAGALLLRAPPVILPLDLQEGVAGVHVGPGPDLLPAEAPVVVVGEHPEVPRVEIHGIIGADARPLRDEDPVPGLRRIPQDSLERGLVGKVLCVNPVHQLHRVHLLQGDGRERLQGAGEIDMGFLRHPG